LQTQGPTPYYRSDDGSSSRENSPKALPEEGWDYIYGINPVLNALKGSRRLMGELFMQEVGSIQHE